MLFTACLSSFGDLRTLSADPHPLVPPLAICGPTGCACNQRTGVCLPFIPACDPAVEGANAGPPWVLTLQEAINTALSNSEAVRNLGLVEAAAKNDLVRSLITSYDPAEAYARAAGEWGIFDPLWTTEIVWDKLDIPPGTSFSGIGNRPPQLDTADAYTSLEQLLPLGTRIRADLVTNYLFNPQNPPGLDPNPQYFSYNQWGVSQPLLRGFGVDVTMAPIKIACAQAERTDWQFKQEILAMVRSIETTYWSLYAQQQNLKAIDEVLPYFREVVRQRQEQATGDLGTESEVARAQSEQYLYEQRRLETLSKIAENQLVLRNLMGLPPDDCRPIELLAVPTTTRPFETLQEAVNTAVNTRPDVLRQRLAVYIATQERLVANNVLKPQLDLNGYYRTNGLGENLDESFESKDSNNFNDWHMGVFFQMPLGRRQGRAELRAAELRVSRERAMLQQTAHQASYEVANSYRTLHWTYQQLQIVANREQSLKQWNQGAKATFENPPSGMTTVFALELYLQNLRDVTDAAISRNTVLADYNSSLARLEEVKGTLLQNRMIVVAGDVSETLPAKLPPAEITMPESSTPLPAPAAVPQAVPVVPAAPPAAVPAAPQGVIVPPSTPIVEQPQSVVPQPLIELPQPIEGGSEAYVEQSITPTPEQSVVEAPPMPTPAPAVEPPAAIAQQSPPMKAAPMEAPSIQMPEAIAASPAPAPALASKAPTASEPVKLQQPAAALPAPATSVAAAPMRRQTVQPSTPVVEAPEIPTPAPKASTERLALRMPETLMPEIETSPMAAAPQSTERSPMAALRLPQTVLPESAPGARPEAMKTPRAAAALSMPSTVLPNADPPAAYIPVSQQTKATAPAALRQPSSVNSPAEASLFGRPQQKSVIKRKATPAPAISLQLPESTQGGRQAAGGWEGASAEAAEGKPLSLNGPALQLQMPSSLAPTDSHSQGG